MSHVLVAHAHCDIPCGIYEPTMAKIAARTVARMVDQILELEPPTRRAEASRGVPIPLAEGSPATEDQAAELAYHNAITRRITVKEQHAETVKRELETLWSDFFKPEHLSKFPKLHDRFWKAIKLASTCKQEVSKEHAAELLKAVDAIAEIFYAVKGVPERMQAYREITDNLYK